MLLPRGTIDPIHKVTVIPRGQALGLTHLLPETDRLSIDADNARGTIAMLMGGRIAEELRYDGRKTTGAGNDIARATQLARRMVCEWGMSETLGPLSYAHDEAEPFLGRDLVRTKTMSESTARAIDEEVHAIVMGEYKRARGLLEDNIKTLERLALSLAERESLSREEVVDLVAGRPLAPLAPVEVSGPAVEVKPSEEKIVAAPPIRRPSGLPVPGTSS
jgi:cell division protease FtsH